jgi:hypothetical protein
MDSLLTRTERALGMGSHLENLPPSNTAYLYTSSRFADRDTAHHEAGTHTSDSRGAKSARPPHPDLTE